MHPDSALDLAIFVSDLQDGNYFCFSRLLLLTFSGYIYIIFQRKKVIRSQNRRNQGFSHYFCLMMEGSKAGSVPRTIGSGSGMPKNIRIRNTGRKAITSVIFDIIEAAVVVGEGGGGCLYVHL
jgi:hypothetical protein